MEFDTLPSKVAMDILTTQEVAQQLRCSKAHVSKAINGKLPGSSPLPALKFGRRTLVRKEALLQWIQANEGAMLSPSPETHHR